MIRKKSSILGTMLGISLASTLTLAAEPPEGANGPPTGDNGESASTQTSNNGGELLDKAQSNGSIRVIVSIDTGFQPSSSNSAAENEKLFMAAIDNTQEAVLQRLQSQNVSGVTRYEYVAMLAMQVDAAGLQALLNDPAVAKVQEDKPVPPTLLQSVPWINADDVHSQGYNGSGFAVAILDTGTLKSHQMLDGGKVVSEACYSTTTSTGSYDANSACPGGVSSSTATGSGEPCDLSWDSGCSHGTHVAGIAAGLNGPGGLQGVAPAADVIAIQVFSEFENNVTNGACNGGVGTKCVLTFTSDQISALERVYALRNTYEIAAANMSLGGGQNGSYCDGDSRKPIIDTLRSAGIATVISSGNDGWNGSLGAPACISSSIAVGSTLDWSDTVSGFSNHATEVDMLAPGSSITSAVASSNTATATWNGTSMAAPHVTGAFALLKNKNGTVTVSSGENALESTGVDVTRAGITKPRIDALAAANTIGNGPKIGVNWDHVEQAYRTIGASGTWAYMESTGVWLYATDDRAGGQMVEGAASGHWFAYNVTGFSGSTPNVNYYRVWKN